MNWTETLKEELTTAYRTVDKLMDLVEPGTLGWKPATGQNWMTVGQLLRHIDSACGSECGGFVSGDWGSPSDTASDVTLPPAEKMPTVASVAEAKKLLSADRKTAFEMLAAAGEKKLDGEPTQAPWDPTKKPLGMRLLEAIRHLNTHKDQLFYYLKLQGKPVHTGHLWGV